MAKIFLIDTRLAALRSVSGLLGTLRRLWKSERMRHFCCVFTQPEDERIQTCEVHGIPWLVSEQPAEAIATLARNASAAGHEPVVVSARAEFAGLPWERLKLTRSHLQVLTPDPQAKPLQDTLDLPFRLEAVTPGACGDLAEYYRRQGLPEHLERVQGLFGNPPSVLQLWS